jgi:hypothetical protein
MCALRPENIIFSYINVRNNIGDVNFENTYINDLKNLNEKYIRNYSAVRLIDKIQQDLFYHHHNNKDTVLFIGNKFINLALYSRRYIKPVGVVTGRKDRIEFFRYGIPYIPANEWQIKLYKAYFESNIAQKMKIIETTLDSIKATMVYFKPKCIILWNDSLFIERAIIYAAKELNIPTITIQHGIFQRISPVNAFDGWYSDYFIVWGKFFKDMYIKNEIKKENEIFILGYPFELFTSKLNETIMPSSTKLKICFLGQPFENYNADMITYKIKAIENIYKVCQKLGMPFIYRPHPGEEHLLIKKYLPYIRITPKKEKLEETFKNNSIFLSINSTALIEAVIRGKVGVQIYIPEIPSDNFDKIGICYTIENNIAQIEELLTEIKLGKKKPYKLNPNYIELCDNIGEKFWGILSTIKH